MESDSQPPKPSIDPSDPVESAYKPSSASEGSGAILWIGIIVGVVGVAFGVIGIFFGLSAQAKADATSAEIEALRAEVPGQIEAGLTGLSNVSNDVVKLKQAIEALKSRSRMDRDSNSRKLETIVKELEANRGQINANIAAIESIPSQLAQARPAPAPAAPTTSSDLETTAESTVTASGQTVHTIASGDLIGRLATQYGVSVQAILDANPGVDPRRLRLGQQIVIPVE